MLEEVLKAESLYCDANVIIYLVEKHPDYSQTVRHLLQQLKARGARLCSSELVIAECLTGAVRRDNADVLAAYEAFFAGDRLGFELVPVTEALLWSAPQVSLDFKLDLPDALHFATALDLGCDAFLTNDKGFTDGEPFPIVYQLSQL